MYRICSVALLALLVAAGSTAHAEETPLERSANDSPGWTHDELPRLTRTDLPATPQRNLPGYRTDSSELSYRWWTRGELGDLGVGVGSVVQVVRPIDMLPGVSAPGAAQWSASATTLLLGLRVRTSERSTVYADAAIGRSLLAGGAEPVVGKVGFELKAARSRWDVAYGGLGLRLSGDAGMSLRLRRGGLAVSWRQSF